ncbi:MAG: transaldolase, partial [Stenotrophomonas sp.]
MSTASKLAQLRELSVVVADTGDYDAIKRLRPVDCTTNPTLVWGRAQSGDKQAIANAVVDRLTVGVGTMLAELVPGRVSTEVDADQAHNTEATIAKAREFIAMYEAAGVPRSKVLIKIAATWAGVEAARVLQAEGID